MGDVSTNPTIGILTVLGPRMLLTNAAQHDERHRKRLWSRLVLPEENDVLSPLPNDDNAGVHVREHLRYGDEYALARSTLAEDGQRECDDQSGHGEDYNRHDLRRDRCLGHRCLHLGERLG